MKSVVGNLEYGFPLFQFLAVQYVWKLEAIFNTYPNLRQVIYIYIYLYIYVCVICGYVRCKAVKLAVRWTPCISLIGEAL
jgi:hypothetical protein